MSAKFLVNGANDTYSNKYLIFKIKLNLSHKNQLIKPCVIKCCILSLFFIYGMKITFVLLFPTVLRV
jgi:hypothetical protein